MSLLRRAQSAGLLRASTARQGDLTEIAVARRNIMGDTLGSDREPSPSCGGIARLTDDSDRCPVSLGTATNVAVASPTGLGKLMIQDTCQHHVADAALAVLAQSPVSELRQLRVDEKENELQLSGRVRSFYHKQLAQETVRGVAAGRQVVNHVSVSNDS